MEATWNIEFGDLALRMAGAEIVVANDCWRKRRRFMVTVNNAARRAPLS
jgi:hypothetical protein